MKRFFPIFIFLSLTLSASAQSVMILHSLDMVDNATALTHYYNLFGSFNMPERDDPFPYSVIRIDLEGDANAVRQAKLQLGLNLGRLQKVQSMDKGTPNQILFLVESSVKNIYLTCGDGCEEQLLYTGSLQSNRIYACKVQYEPAASPNTSSNVASSGQMDSMMVMMQKMQQQMMQMQQTQQNQSSTPNDNGNDVASSSTTTSVGGSMASILTTIEKNENTSSSMDNNSTSLSSSSNVSDQSVLPPTVRNGNKYMVGYQTMKKREYEAYLKNTCPDAYKKFYSGRKLANVGWGLFVGGIPVYTAGYLLANGKNAGTAEKNGGMIIAYVGLASFLSGIVCVSVGYGQMHKAAKIYNKTTQPQPAITLSVQSSANGIGLALHF